MSVNQNTAFMWKDFDVENCLGLKHTIISNIVFYKQVTL